MASSNRECRTYSGEKHDDLRVGLKLHLQNSSRTRARKLCDDTIVKKVGIIDDLFDDPQYGIAIF
jgi:hypothetical protein